MKITKENYNIVPEEEQKILVSLLDCLDEINGTNLYSNNLYIIWIEEQTYWSSERVDPCPDYYGMYRLWQGNKTLGIEMDLEVLDYVLAVLSDIFVDDY